MNKFIKKILLLMMCVFAVGTLIACTDDNSPSDDTYTDDGFVARGEGLDNAIVVFHYQRKNADYENWCMWVWSQDGIRLHAVNSDKFGVYYKIDLGDDTKDYYHARRLGYIYHYSENDGWGSKDLDMDRFVDLSESMLKDKNEIHFYNFEGEETMYLDANKNNPVCNISSFSLGSGPRILQVALNTKAVSYELFKNGELYKTAEVNAAEFQIFLPSNAPFTLGD